MVAARPFHAVDAHVNAPDADDIFHGERARGIVFGRHEPVPRIHRHRAGRTEINVTETEHEVIGGENGFINPLDAVEAVHTADELDVARQPRRLGAHALHVFLDHQMNRRVVVGQRHPDDAGWDFERFNRWQFLFRLDKNGEQFFQGDDAAVEVDLQRTHAGRKLDDALRRMRLEPFHEQMRAETQLEIQHERAVFDQQKFIARLPVDHAGIGCRCRNAVENRIIRRRGFLRDEAGCWRD